MFRDYEKNLLKETFEQLYVAGYLANSLRQGDDYLFGRYQLEDHAQVAFDEHYGTLEELIRNEVRDEEMEIARRDIPQLEDQIGQLEKDLERVKAENELRAVKDLLNILDLYEVENPEVADGEAWAYNDGVNSIIAKLKARLTVYRDNH